jgi:hypothetical protein
MTPSPPSTKVTAGAVVTVVAFVSTLVLGRTVELDESAVASALGLVIFIVQYLVPDRRPAPSAVRAVTEAQVATVSDDYRNRFDH